MKNQLTSRGTKVLIISLMMFVFSLGLAAAQEQKPASGNGNSANTAETQKKSAAQPNAPQNDSFGQTLVKESQEAEGEDAAEFKHAPAIQFLSRVTGLSMKGAWWLALGLNFAVIAAVILWASKKYLPGVFSNRTAMIQKAMEEARQASADANRRLSEIEARLSRLDSEIGAMRANADKEAAAEESRILEAAKEDSRKIVESAEQEVVAAAKQVRRELTAYAADLAVALAKKQIHVDAATDQQLVRGFADQLTNGGKVGR